MWLWQSVRRLGMRRGLPAGTESQAGRGVGLGLAHLVAVGAGRGPGWRAGDRGTLGGAGVCVRVTGGAARGWG
jgi:hypothetical protein